jgi:hypothetical protein
MGHRHPLLWARLRGSKRGRLSRGLVFVMVALASIHLWTQNRMYRKALAVKYSPTTFPILSTEEHAALEDPRWHWEHHAVDARAASSREELLSSRAEWKKLGQGFEGEVFTHRDSVVKVFRRTYAPFRNCVPGWSPELRWPTEISASLLLGGMSDDDEATIGANASFLPVNDYFLSREENGAPSRWHFVTPFLRLGTLEKLAKRLRQSPQHQEYTAQRLDVIFRPSLDRLLHALRHMHEDYDLCHDDIKLDNIFLGGEDTEEQAQPENMTHWMLGDLGNVREREHPYHASPLWTKQNLADCRASDVVRLLKAYVAFLRKAADEPTVVDRQLFEGAQPWSRLFWAVVDEAEAVGGAVTARTALERSAKHQAAPYVQDSEVVVARHEPLGLRSPLYRLFVGRDWIMSAAATAVLKVGASDKAARMYGLVWALGVPFADCRPEPSVQ